MAQLSQNVPTHDLKMAQLSQNVPTISKCPNFLMWRAAESKESYEISEKLQKVPENAKSCRKLQEIEKVTESCGKWQKLWYRNYRN